MTRAFFLLSLVLIMPVTANAENIEYDMLGIGNTSCAELGKLYKQNPVGVDTLYYSWYTGFVTGANVAFQIAGVGFKNIAGTHQKDKMPSLRRYCDEHPMLSFHDAVIEDFKSLPSVAGNKSVKERF